jgi:hypothetical protein
LLQIGLAIELNETDFLQNEPNLILFYKGMARDSRGSRQLDEEMRLTHLSYEDWLEHAFGREVRIQQAAWFFDHDCDWWDPESAVAVDYLTRLFEGPEPALRWYSDSQIAQGLTYLVNTSATGDNGWFYSTGVAIEDRVRSKRSLPCSRNFSCRAAPRICRI